MGLFGSIIGGALGVGGAIFGGMSASKAMRGVKEDLERRRRENEDWYNARYNEDATQRADAQRVLTNLNEGIRQRNQQAAATAAVMGGTEESVAATKAANAQAMADAASQIAAAGERRKDQVESRYMSAKDGIDDRLANMEVGRAQAVAQAAQGIADAGAGIADFI